MGDLTTWSGFTNEAIYERADVKRGGADFVWRAPAHPLRRRLRSIWPISDLSADDLVVQPATHPLSPRPREIPPSLPAVYEALAERDVIRSTIYSGSTVGYVVAIKPVSKERHHSIARKSAMGPLSGFVAGSFTWSSRPPAFARQVARSHRGWVRFTLGSPSFFGVEGRLAILVMVCYAGDVFTDFKRFIVILGVLACVGMTL